YAHSPHDPYGSWRRIVWQTWVRNGKGPTYILVLAGQQSIHPDDYRLLCRYWGNSKNNTRLHSAIFFKHVHFCRGATSRTAANILHIKRNSKCRTAIYRRDDIYINVLHNQVRAEYTPAN